MTRLRSIERTLRHVGSPIDLDVLKRRSWAGLAAEFVRFPVPLEYDFHLDHSANVLVLLDVYRHAGETVVTGLPRSQRKDLRNRLTFIPKGIELKGWAAVDRPSCATTVYFDFDAAAAGRPPLDLAAIAPLLEFEDHMLRTVVMQIQAILHDPSLDVPGYAETLGTLLVYELGRLKNQAGGATVPHGGLSPRQVRIVIDYLESRLTDKTTIAELSALLDLSRFHFIRAFKKTVGVPPHQFIVQRRVARARELLHDSRLSISEIASQTGFNSTTHFAKSFRRVTGTTPAAFRRDAH